MTYQMPEARIGNKYEGYQDAAVVAKKVRADIKAAKAEGFLPTDLKVSVRCSKYAGGQSVRIVLSGWASERVAKDHRMTPEAEQVKQRVEALRSAYNRNASDPMIDYFDNTYYGTTEWDYKLWW